MKDNTKSEKLEQQSMDHIMTVARATISAIPIVGPLLTELAGVIVPNQRLTRIAKFVVELEKKLHGLEIRQAVMEQLKDEHFTDLLEEGVRQAAHSLSDKRRQYLAAVIANSLSSERIQHMESRHLLRILNEVNDIEIVWLRSYLISTLQGDETFRDEHRQVLKPIAATFGSSQAVIDQATLQKSYKAHLCELGLLEETYRIDHKTRQPKFDSNGKQEVQGYQITGLGRLLLKTIGFSDE